MNYVRSSFYKRVFQDTRPNGSKRVIHEAFAIRPFGPHESPRLRLFAYGDLTATTRKV